MLAIILADGDFPKKNKRQDLLKHMEHIICCDGAAEKLLEFGREPEAIVGDMDSLPESLKLRFSDRVHTVDEQETNDLTKAVQYCIQNGYDELAILGATGLREDHTLGNISLLADYAKQVKSVCLLTDYGRIDAVCFGGETQDDTTISSDLKAPLVSMTRDGKFTVARFESFNGQQVSIFSLDPQTSISTLGLKYPIDGKNLTSWWQGTLNECSGEQFSLSIDRGTLLVYRLDQVD